jgi:hypothetical protein
MTRNETPPESLKGYLRQLSPQTRSRLLLEIERLRQSGENVPGGELLLGELRAEIREDGRAFERLDQPARHFFRPLEPYLTDRPPERANAGQISRASLPAIWDWIGRDLMASMVRDYLATMKKFIGTGSQHEIDQAVQVFVNKAVKYLEGALKSTSGLEHARTRLVAYGAAKACLDDLAKMLKALRAREALAQFAQALPPKIDRLDGALLEKTRGALDKLAEANGETVPFALILVGQRLAAPWQLMRLATKAVETKDATEIAKTPYALAVGIVLDQLEDQVEVLYAALKAEHLPRAKELLTGIYDIEYQLGVRIDFGDTPWGHQLDTVMARVERYLSMEMTTLPSGLRHVLRSRGLRSNLSIAGQLTWLKYKCRDAVTDGMSFGRNLISGLRGKGAA